MYGKNVRPADVRLGLEVTFCPVEHLPQGARPDDMPDGPVRVTGRIIYINAPHRFYTVEGRGRRGTFRESFKF